MDLLQTWNLSSRPVHSKKGFTLIEIAVVLVILGLIIGSLAPLMVSMIKRDKIKSANDIVKKASSEIIGYVITNKKLPNSLSDLGHQKDPWKNSLFYIQSADLIGKDICKEDKSKLVVYKYEPVAPGKCTRKSVIKNVACIIGSKGPNFNRQINDPRRNIVVILDYSCKGDYYPKDLSRRDNFDDIYEVITLYQLKGRACGDVSPTSQPGSGSGGKKEKKPPEKAKALEKTVKTK